METVETSIVRRATGEIGAATPVVPRVNVRVREGTEADLPFIDRMQKAHSRELGFLPRQALEGKIKLGQVLIAEVCEGAHEGAAHEVSGIRAPVHAVRGSSEPAYFVRGSSRPSSPVGYLIAADRYFRRDEIGYVTQINVVPEHRRSLVAAALLQHQFDRSAYGCRLYCCWCAQDLKANEFWEAMGFAPIAFRTGSRTRGKNRTPRIHLFWQKRIRAGDVSTPWWYPSQTGGGEMREDRLVFPIPPDVGWRDVLPVVLPQDGEGEGRLLESPAPATKRRAKKKKVMVTRTVMRPRGPRMPGGLWFADDLVPVQETVEEWVDAGLGDDGQADAPRPKAAPRPIDPRLLAMARELRDRWGERAGGIADPPAVHDVRRAIAGEAATPRLVAA